MGNKRLRPISISSKLFVHAMPCQQSDYAESAEIIGYMKYDEEKWENTSIGRRGEDYKAFKEIKAQQLLQKLRNLFLTYYPISKLMKPQHH